MYVCMYVCVYRMRTYCWACPSVSPARVRRGWRCSTAAPCTGAHAHRNTPAPTVIHTLFAYTLMHIELILKKNHAYDHLTSSNPLGVVILLAWQQSRFVFRLYSVNYTVINVCMHMYV